MVGVHHVVAGAIRASIIREKLDCVRAGLCCLWNLSHPANLRQDVAECAATALAEAAGSAAMNADVAEWCARVVWLLAEVPAARRALITHPIGMTLSRCAIRD